MVLLGCVYMILRRYIVSPLTDSSVIFLVSREILASCYIFIIEIVYPVPLDSRVNKTVLIED